MSQWTFASMKMKPRNILAGFMFLQLLNMTYAFSCSYDVGLATVSVECPTPFQDKNKIFCCTSSDTVPYCCDLNEFIRTNTAILAGIIVGVIVLLLIVVICCCCFCSCCLLAQRRQQRGTVLSAPRL